MAPRSAQPVSAPRHRRQQHPRLLLRDKFQRSKESLAEAENHLRAITRHVLPTEQVDIVAADPDDNRILECAIAVEAEVIVSGDADLLELDTFRSIPVMTVAEFLTGFQQATI